MRDAGHAEYAVLLPDHNCLVVLELKDANRADGDADGVAVAFLFVDLNRNHRDYLDGKT